MKTAIVNVVGFDGGGISKLGIEYSKLGFDVYFKDAVQPLQFKPKNFANVRFYNTIDELSGKLKNYDRIIFLTFYDNDLDNTVSNLATLRTNLLNSEFCYLYCDRNIDRLLRLQESLKKYNLKFDHYFSINPNISNIVTNYTHLNVNAFMFSPIKSYSNDCRQNIILTAGRVEGFKGVLSYFHSVDEKFLKSDYFYIHEGARFNFNKSGTISAPPQLLTLFDTTKTPKQPKSEFVFKVYGELPESHKLTIYPSYSIDDISRWANYYAGICCILGSKSMCRNIRNFVGSTWIADDSRENNLLTKKSKLWNTAIEYANLEMLDAGLPVLFSRKYSEIIDFTDEFLIYNSFSEIPIKIEELKSNYDNIRRNQREFFVNRWSAVNENIKRVFTEPLEVFT